MKIFKIPNLFTFVSDAKGYDLKKFKADIIAALTVALIALPQSMAYAIIAGVNPKYGLYAAIIPVIISSLLGSSKFLIAGPTNAVSMVIYSTIASTAVGGTMIANLPEEQKMAGVFFLAFMVGAIQVVMGLARMGNFINFVSHSVVVGFTAGAGILIGFNQLKNFFGLDIKSSPHFTETVINTFSHIGGTNIPSLAVGLYTVILILLLKKFLPKLPGLFIAMVTSGLIAGFFHLNDFGVKFIGQIPRTLPPLSSFAFNFELFHDLFMPAVALSILAIVEALSIGKAISNISGEKIDGNREFVAQGLTNMISAFVSSIPGTGSFTRSAVNFKSGALTRFAGVFSGLLVLLTLLVFAPWARFIPMPSLAGALIVIAYSMVDKKAFVFSFKATKTDRLVLLTTLFSTMFLELESAIFIGVFFSIASYINKASKPDVYEIVPREGDGKLVICDKPGGCCQQIAINQIDGSLFFASTNLLEESLFNQVNKKVVILRMKNVRIMDATGAHSLEKFIKDCHNKGIRIIFSGMKNRVKAVLENAGVFEIIDKTNIVEDTKTAIDVAFKKYIDRESCKSCKKKIFKEC